MSLKQTTIKEIDKAMDNYYRDIAMVARNNAVRSYVAGDIIAHRVLGLDISFNLIQKEALEYSKGYGKLLYREGATIIRGKKVPWLKDSTTRTRERVFTIIRDGLEEGKPVAQIGGKRIVPGTIAHDLRTTLIREREFEYVRIARTEVGRIQNQGTLTRYAINDVTEVDVLDDEGPNSCDACREINGQRWTLEYARTHELEHPNCVRAFTPVIQR